MIILILDQASSTASQRGHSPFSAPATPATAHSISTNVSVSSHQAQTSSSTSTRRGSKRAKTSNDGLVATALRDLPIADPLSGVRAQSTKKKSKGKGKEKDIIPSTKRSPTSSKASTKKRSALRSESPTAELPPSKRAKSSEDTSSSSVIRRSNPRTKKDSMVQKKQHPSSASSGPSKSRTSTGSNTSRSKSRSASGATSSTRLVDLDQPCGPSTNHMDEDDGFRAANSFSVHTETDEEEDINEGIDDEGEVERDTLVESNEIDNIDHEEEDEEDNEDEEGDEALDNEDDYEDEEDDPDQFDEDPDDPYGDGDDGGGFGGHIRAMAGYMTGLAGRFRTLLNSLRDRRDPTAQLVALQELSEVLSISNEDTLAGYFPTESFVGELIYLMGGPKPTRTMTTKEKSKEEIEREEEEDSLAAALALEDNSETMLLACRCLANLIEAMPYAAHSVVSHGAVPVLNAKLVQIEFIDLAEQVLQTMEKISNEFPSAIVREGGLSAMLQYLDFFNIHVQRTAMNAASNCCRRLSPEQFDKAKDVMPIIKNVLSYSDQRLVESACRCVVRLIDSYRHHTDLLEQLLDDGVVGSINAVLLPGSTTSSSSTTISTTIYTDILKGLGTAARVSPSVAVTLLENNIVETLYVLLTGSSAPSEDGGDGRGPAANMNAKKESESVEDNAGAAFAVVNSDGSENVAIADVAILQNLAQRPKEQVQEALSLVAELLPPLPRDGVFDSRQYTEKAYNRRKAKAQKLEKRNSDFSSTSSPESRSKSQSAAAADESGDRSNAQNSPSQAVVKPERVKSERELSREKAQSRRIAALREKQALVKRFTQLVLPTLVEVYAASVGWSVRSKALYGILKIVSFVENEPLLQALDNVPLASFVASILSSRDHAMLVQGALQLVELLTTKLPNVYSSLLRREGVMWEIEDIASKEPTGKGKEGREKSKEQNGEQSAETSGHASDPAAPLEISTTRDGESRLPSIALPSSNLSRLLAISNSMQAGTISSRIIPSNQSRSTVSTAPPGMATVGGQLMSATDAADSNIWRARVLCDSLSPQASKASAGGADEAGRALNDITDLVETLKQEEDEDNAKSTLKSITDLFCKSENPISSFELLRSGLVDGLCAFVNGDQNAMPKNVRERLLTEAIMQNPIDPSKPSAAAVLVRKLQETLSRLEDMEITTAIYNSEEMKRSPTANVARQVRLKLIAEGSDAGDIPRTCTNIVVSIHAITSFQSLHDHLRPKIAASQSMFGASSSSAPGPSSGLSTMLESLASNAGIELTEAFRESLRAAATASSTGRPSSTSRARLEIGEGESSGSTSNATGKEANKSSRRRSSRLSGKSSADDEKSKAKDEDSKVEEKEGETEESPEETMTRKFVEDILGDMEGLEGGEAFSDDEYDEELVEDEDMSGLDPTSINAGNGDETVQLEVAQDGETKKSSKADSSAILSKSAPSSDNSSSPSKAAASSSSGKISYANALQKKPVDWHLQFEMDGEKVSLASTIYSAIHKHEMRNKPANAAASAGRHIWANTYTVKYRKVSGPSPDEEEKERATPDPSVDPLELTTLPDSISPKATYASILLLLRVLYNLNRRWKETSEWRRLNNHRAINALNEAAFVNNKLTAKLNRQLEEPMIVASNCMPQWSLDLPRAFPFLFPFEARYAFLQSTSFGYHRLINRWQTQQSRNQDGSNSSSARHDDSLALLGRLTRQKVRISRSNILASAFKVFELYGTNSSLLEVEYFDEVGTGLGPTLEFYAMVSREFAKKSTHMWRSDEGRSGESEYVYSTTGLFPAPCGQDDVNAESSGPVGKSRAHAFKIMGQFVAKALFDSRIVDLNLSTMFMRLVLNECVPNTLDMLRQVDPTLAQSLDKIQSMQADELESLSLDFTLPGYADYELHAGGKDEQVDSTNVSSYIEEVITHTLNTGVKPLVRAFREGFNLIFPINAMSTFTPEEVVMLFGNQEEDWSESTLLSSVKPDHGYNVDSQTFRDVISVMSTFTPVERRDFLQWLTGSPKLPIGGFAGLHPHLTIVKRTPDSNQIADQTLPSVMTCVNFCKMPPFSTRSIMKERLSLAMREGQASFHLS
ncbi:uncharacterized protein FA14DRAFT_164637 [Meira miltonrushii]|uniref:HECT-type E3 ubiquitin transferase n=1 Tax=Meira miltonrushii TaxID=1280837 RepID=A0A316VEZ6_9BASI|nr:uncharacterized protein FA14DRAFT_164637 [Meira miltonrushii]PWN36096.1 hypothetical protein FA14DRAFT_164637 [Meira miltonrushii]